VAFRNCEQGAKTTLLCAHFLQSALEFLRLAREFADLAYKKEMFQESEAEEHKDA